MQNRTLFTVRRLLQATMPSLTALDTENGRPCRRACCFKPRPVPRGLWKSTIIAGLAYFRTRFRDVGDPVGIADAVVYNSLTSIDVRVDEDVIPPATESLTMSSEVLH